MSIADAVSGQDVVEVVGARARGELSYRLFCQAASHSARSASWLGGPVGWLRTNEIHGPFFASGGASTTVAETISALAFILWMTLRSRCCREFRDGAAADETGLVSTGADVSR